MEEASSPVKPSSGSSVCPLAHLRLRLTADPLNVGAVREAPPGALLLAEVALSLQRSAASDRRLRLQVETSRQHIYA